jgi:DNA modification methylase
MHGSLQTPPRGSHLSFMPTRLRPLASPQATMRIQADARSLPIASDTVDLCVSSPPYWRKRDYGHHLQIGHERSPEQYADNLRAAMHEVRRVLKMTGSVFLNIGDTYYRRSLAGVPHLVEAALREDGWRVRNRIVWAKPNGLPTPHRDRLANRHEVVLHLTGPDEYFYDLEALCQYMGTRFPGGDIWELRPARHLGRHPAAFPEELPGRAIALACPERVCRRCGEPRVRQLTRGADLDLNRQQARRALALAKQHGLTKRHLAAIRATGISDAGKAMRLQEGAGLNTRDVQKLAAEAKKALRGYFREFTFARPTTTGYTKCSCAKGWNAGLVLDMFAGTGTTLRAATRLGRRSIGVDLSSWCDPEHETSAANGRSKRSRA